MSFVSTDEQHIKRPLNSFMVWAKEKRRTMNRDNPKMRNAEISKILGEEWRQMPDEAKQPYVEEAVRLRKQHKVDHPNYRYKPKRKLRQEQAALEKARSDGVPLFSGIYPNILPSPVPSDFSSPSYPVYTPGLFKPRFPADRLPFPSDMFGKTPSTVPSSVFGRGLNVPPAFSVGYPGPSSSFTYGSESPRLPLPKDNPIRISPLRLQPSPTSRTGSALSPRVSGISDPSKQPVPYLMLKAEVQYM